MFLLCGGKRRRMCAEHGGGGTWHEHLPCPHSALTLTPFLTGTMMVRSGDADGMVSGAMCTTANTIRPALQAGLLQHSGSWARLGVQ